MAAQDRAAIHVASANYGQEVLVEYNEKYDSYIIDLRPRGPKHAKITLNTQVVEKLVTLYNKIKEKRHA